jgi:ribosomal protein L11 methyltransferase
MMADLAGMGLPVAPYRIFGAELSDELWKDRWREYFRPRAVGQRLWIRPPWADLPVEAGDALEVIIDPGLAFGTGTHATTRLCLEALERFRSGPEEPPRSLLDVGTGTAILSIAGHLLGYRPIVAVDNDRDALLAARENLALNGRTGEVTLTEELPRGRFHLVVANILADTLLELRGAIADRLMPGGVLLLSGVLSGEAEQVEGAYQELGLSPLRAERAEDGDWLLLAFRR